MAKIPEKIRIVLEIEGKDRIVFPLVDCGARLPQVQGEQKGHCTISVHDFDEDGKRLYGDEADKVVPAPVRRFVKISVLGELVSNEDGVQYYIEGVTEEGARVFSEEGSSRAPSSPGTAENL